MRGPAGKITGRIAGLQKTSLIDWEGKLVSVVFLSGCNWSCPFCHNWELCSIKKVLSDEDVFAFLQERKEWIDGVVICGGEPMLRRDVVFLAERLKNEGYAVKIDTNGAFPEILKELTDNRLIDYVAMDLKTALKDEKYLKATGVAQLDNVRKSMDVLLVGDTEFEFRTTMVPEIVSEEDILFNLRFIEAGTKYVLQQFSNENVNIGYFKNIKPYDKKSFENIVIKMKQKGVIAWLRD